MGIAQTNYEKDDIEEIGHEKKSAKRTKYGRVKLNSENLKNHCYIDAVFF
jgi:hypothetical protein